MSHHHIDASACRALWVEVFATALRDALTPGHDAAAETAQRQADVWFRSGRDMLMVAALAGLDGRLIRQRYLAGKIDSSLLAGNRQVKRAA